ncbi:hypothetical protein B5X24_HaOG202069 [Helicoverpa armigera]|uniref:Uncharacterized protein n=1 Tax=Helicoverpa armigera TaxID=29058 RepID=A0A2W1C2Y2_HELAM|nr:hypothetical protein B5X24_HaOG202069 [Helicoverpa armigera]
MCSIGWCSVATGPGRMRGPRSWALSAWRKARHCATGIQPRLPSASTREPTVRSNFNIALSHFIIESHARLHVLIIQLRVKLFSNFTRCKIISAR